MYAHFITGMLCALTYVYTHTYMHIYIHACMHTYIHTSLDGIAQTTDIHTYSHECICTYTQAWMVYYVSKTEEKTLAHIYKCIYIHTYRLRRHGTEYIHITNAHINVYIPTYRPGWCIMCQKPRRKHRLRFWISSASTPHYVYRVCMRVYVHVCVCVYACVCV